MEINNLTYAINYAKRGLRVMPVYYVLSDGACSCGNRSCRSVGKHPLTAHGSKDATTDIPTLVGWWTSTPTANVALATGRDAGFVVIDVDPRNGGEETFENEFFPTGDGGVDYDTVAAFTGGGGRHFLFRYEPGLRGKLGPGVDVKSDGGYILVEPSNHVSGDPYTWEDGRSPLDAEPVLAELPPHVLAVLRGERSSKKSSSALGLDWRGNNADSEFSEIRRDEIRAALNWISSDGRDEWLRVGMALHHESDGPQAFALWSEWSQTSDRYDPEDQGRVWRSFSRSRDDGVTLNTLFSMARAGGWSPRDDGSFSFSDDSDVVFEIPDDAPTNGSVPSPFFGLVDSWEEFNSVEFGEPEPLVGELISKQSINMISALRGLGKTHVAVSISCALAQGVPFMGWDVISPGRVLFVDGEMTGHSLQQRFRQFLEPSKPALLDVMSSERFHGVTESDLNLADEMHQANFIRILDGLNSVGRDPELIVFDNMSSLTRGNEENSNDDVRKLTKFFVHLRRRGHAVLFVHHAGLNGNPRGASAWEEYVDLSVVMRPKTKNATVSDPAEFKWTYNKCRSRLPSGEFDAKLVGGDGRLTWETTAPIELDDSWVSEEPNEEPTAQVDSSHETAIQSLHGLEHPITSNEFKAKIRALLGVSLRTAETILQAIRGDPRIVAERKGVNTFWSINPGWDST